jgi:hypothetical protein
VIRFLGKPDERLGPREDEDVAFHHRVRPGLCARSLALRLAQGAAEEQASASELREEILLLRARAETAENLPASKCRGGEGGSQGRAGPGDLFDDDRGTEKIGTCAVKLLRHRQVAEAQRGELLQQLSRKSPSLIQLASLLARALTRHELSHGVPDQQMLFR